MVHAKQREMFIEVLLSQIKPARANLSLAFSKWPAGHRSVHQVTVSAGSILPFCVPKHVPAIIIVPLHFYMSHYNNLNVICAILLVRLHHNPFLKLRCEGLRSIFFLGGQQQRSLDLRLKK